MKLKTIIIEDEPIAQKKLEGYIERTELLVNLNTFDDALPALEFLAENNVDLIFLDIKLKDISGIDFLKITENVPNVIITSAYQEYAIDGFEFEVCDFLLKPFDLERFLRSVHKALKNRNTINRDTNKIFIKTGCGYKALDKSEFCYAEGMRDYLNIVTDSGKILSLLTFDKLKTLLPDSNFQRVHRSYLVSVEKVKKIERNRIYIKDKIIPISDKYRNNFYSQIKIV